MVEAAVKGVELEYADRMVKLLVTFLPDNFKKPGGLTFYLYLLYYFIVFVSLCLSLIN